MKPFLVKLIFDLYIYFLGCLKNSLEYLRFFPTPSQFSIENFDGNISVFIICAICRSKYSSFDVTNIVQKALYLRGAEINEFRKSIRKQLNSINEENFIEISYESLQFNEGLQKTIQKKGILSILMNDSQSFLIKDFGENKSTSVCSSVLSF